MTTTEIAPTAVEIPTFARTYTDVTGRTQYAVDGPRGTFLITRKNDSELWTVWRSDSLGTSARLRNTARAIERAAELAGVVLPAGDQTDAAADSDDSAERLADFDKDDLKAMCVLANDFAAFDLADHLADVMPETVDGRRIWDMPPLELAMLAASHYPGGAVGLHLTLED